MEEKLMKEALKEAKKAYEKDEIPVGAVIVKDGKIIARAHNLKETKNSALAHAEILAIKKATKKLNNWRLLDCEMYVTLEPCPMCTGAIINSRIKTVVFGAYDLNSGSMDSVINLCDYPYEKTPEVYGGICEDECAALLSEFFGKVRSRDA